jgi:hypothetical protein
MIETGWKGRNMDVFRTGFAMDSREGTSKFLKGMT